MTRNGFLEAAAQALVVEEQGMNELEEIRLLSDVELAGKPLQGDPSPWRDDSQSRWRNTYSGTRCAGQPAHQRAPQAPGLYLAPHGAGKPPSSRIEHHACKN